MCRLGVRIWLALGSSRGAVPPLGWSVSPTRPAEPDMRVTTHPALHRSMPLGYTTVRSMALVHGLGMRSAR